MKTSVREGQGGVQVLDLKGKITIGAGDVQLRETINKLVRVSRRLLQELLMRQKHVPLLHNPISARVMTGKLQRQVAQSPAISPPRGTR